MTAPLPTAPDAPRANVLVDGFRTPIPRVPEDAAAIKERERMYFRTLCPRNYFHAWLADDVALMTLRLERVARIERRERDRIALRAEFFWDDDRRGEAEQLGRRLAGDPAGTVELLRKTPQGCDWMIRRWALLAREADRVSRWDEAQTALAFDLLGTPHVFRGEGPGRTIDDDGRAREGPADLAGLARREIAALRERRAAVADADALDRSLAMADMTEQTTPELRRLRRYEATLHKRLRWDLHQLQIDPKYPRPNSSLEYLYEPEPTPDPEPAAAPEPSPAPDPEPTPAPTSAAPTPEPEPEPETLPIAREPAPTPSRRRDPLALKAEARREAKKRRADRLDN